MDIAHSLYLNDILEHISDALLAPVIIILLFLLGYALWSIGSVTSEVLTERRNYKENMPDFLARLAAAKPDDAPTIIHESGLLRHQKKALLVLWDYRLLPEETYVALAKRLIATEDLRYRRIADRQGTASRIAPMFGLMGTLIPLGPGIVALGQNDLTVLSSSIGTAFYTTVVGLVAASVFFVISKLRSNWYEEYMTSLESAATTVLELVERLREEGKIGLDEPGTSAVDLGYEKADETIGIAEEVAAQSLAYAKEADEAKAEGKDEGANQQPTEALEAVADADAKALTKGANKAAKQDALE